MLENKEFWSSINHFKKSEFTCKCGCGHNNISHKLITRLDKARSIANVPFIINSAVRCEKHNREIHGSPTSSHLKGYAVDIHIDNDSDRFKILMALASVGFRRFGVYKTFIHCDNDNDKTQNVIWYK